MRNSAMVVCLVLLLAACGQPADSVRAEGMLVRPADNPYKIPAAGLVNPDPRVGLDPLWVAFKDPRFDYAFARVSRPGGGSIVAQVASALWLGEAPAPVARGSP
jgi:hypothetical protein